MRVEFKNGSYIKCFGSKKVVKSGEYLYNLLPTDAELQRDIDRLGFSDIITPKEIRENIFGCIYKYLSNEVKK